MIRFMLERQVKAIVIACNTATSAAIELMRRKYPIPIVGMEPAVKKAVDLGNGDGRILIAATPVTVRGRKMAELVERVDTERRADLLALPGLVQFAERGEFASEAVEDYLRRQLAAFDLNNYSAFVLGCTHFNYFKDTLRRLLPGQVQFVDGNEGTVNRLKNLLQIGQPGTVKPAAAEPAGRAEENGVFCDGSGLPPALLGAEYYYSGCRVTDPGELAHLQTCLARLEAMLAIG